MEGESQVLAFQKTFQEEEEAEAYQEEDLKAGLEGDQAFQVSLCALHSEFLVREDEKEELLSGEWPSYQA